MPFPTAKLVSNCTPKNVGSEVTLREAKARPSGSTAPSGPCSVKLKPGETVVFRSRAHRDRVNAKVMKDPRLAKMMDPKAMPFDGRRMIYGGFKVLLDA
jgi:uncharacterized protein YbaA (DUF1428 family)